MGRLLIVIGLFFFVLGLISNFFDVSMHINGSKGVNNIGHIWYYFGPKSLQLTEVIVSRYIDPCSSLDILNCTGFLWHPIISTILSFPAGLSFPTFSFFLIYFGLKKRMRPKKINKN